MAETKNVDPSIQLRALRWAMGENFKPMPSEEFADLIGIPPQAIRAVESRRRKLSDTDRLNIEFLLGTTWNAKRREWVDKDGAPFTREKCKFHRNKSVPDPVLKEEVYAAYDKIVDLYLSRVGPLKFRLALTKFERELRQILMQDNIALGIQKTLQNVKNVSSPPPEQKKTEP